MMMRGQQDSIKPLLRLSQLLQVDSKAANSVSGAILLRLSHPRIEPDLLDEVSNMSQLQHERKHET